MAPPIYGKIYIYIIGWKKIISKKTLFSSPRPLFNKLSWPYPIKFLAQPNIKKKKAIWPNYNPTWPQAKKKKNK
jgi:hypothetical protein